MWSTSFAELAKKAQEATSEISVADLAKKAQEATSESISQMGSQNAAMPSLFNLDSMMDDINKKSDTTANNNSTDTSATIGVVNTWTSGVTQSFFGNDDNGNNNNEKTMIQRQSEATKEVEKVERKEKLVVSLHDGVLEKEVKEEVLKQAPTFNTENEKEEPGEIRSHKEEVAVEDDDNDEWDFKDAEISSSILMDSDVVGKEERSQTNNEMITVEEERKKKTTTEIFLEDEDDAQGGDENEWDFNDDQVEEEGEEGNYKDLMDEHNGDKNEEKGISVERDTYSKKNEEKKDSIRKEVDNGIEKKKSNDDDNSFTDENTEENNVELEQEHHQRQEQPTSALQNDEFRPEGVSIDDVSGEHEVEVGVIEQKSLGILECGGEKPIIPEVSPPSEERETYLHNDEGGSDSAEKELEDIEQKVTMTSECIITAISAPKIQLLDKECNRSEDVVVAGQKCNVNEGEEECFRNSEVSNTSIEQEKTVQQNFTHAKSDEIEINNIEKQTETTSTNIAELSVPENLHAFEIEDSSACIETGDEQTTKDIEKHNTLELKNVKTTHAEQNDKTKRIKGYSDLDMDIKTMERTPSTDAKPQIGQEVNICTEQLYIADDGEQLANQEHAVTNEDEHSAKPSFDTDKIIHEEGSYQPLDDLDEKLIEKLDTLPPNNDLEGESFMQSDESESGGDLDAMYEDSDFCSESDSNVEKVISEDEEQQDSMAMLEEQKESVVLAVEEQLDTMEEDEETLNKLPSPIPQFALEKFMSQLERLHDQHEEELNVMEKKHILTVNEMKDELQTAQASKSNNDVVSQDKYLAQVRKLEKEYNVQLEEKEKALVDLSQKNKSLDGKIQEMNHDTEELKQSLKEKNEKLATVDEKEAKIRSLQIALSDSQANYESSQEAFTTLKSRVKVVATELKDRRVECRSLNVSVKELTEQKSFIESENEDLVSKLSRQTKMNVANNGRIECLQSELTELQQKHKITEMNLIERGSVGDKALSVYKKKAQQSLANANARAAAANLAREEAEIDASNARNEAENAAEMASSAEVEKETIISRCQEEVEALINQNDVLKDDLSVVKEELESTRLKKTELFKDVDDAQKVKETLLEEIQEMNEAFAKEKEKSASLNQELALSRIKGKGLQDEVEFLKEEKSASAAFLARQRNEGLNSAAAAAAIANDTVITGEKSESDGTVVILQEEIKAANDAIKELKEFIGKILSENPSILDEVPTSLKETSIGYELSEKKEAKSASNPSGTVGCNDTTPLFFAIEKQSELNTAREEISRLAAMLGDAEAAKMESFEAMESMRQKMDDAESRLKRFKKLGAASGALQRNGSSLSSSLGNWRSSALSPRNGSILSNKNNNDVISSHSDSTVNLEYLKNMMLNYLNAKTLNEKKALLPVIAAVLELTKDEELNAMESLEKSAGIEGVGTSLFENIQNKGVVSGLFG